MDRLFADVSRFLDKFPPARPAAIAAARCDLLEEEDRELQAAVRAGDAVRVAHEGVDLLYAIVGAWVEAGLTAAQIRAVWDEVARANQAKIAPVPPARKALKPIGWQPPAVIDAVIWASEAAARRQTWAVYAVIALVAVLVVALAVLVA